MPTTPELTRDFLAALDEIYINNIDEFIPESGKWGKLTDHCNFALESGKAKFGFVPQSQLSNSIRKKCFVAFDRFFPDGYVVGGLFRRNY